MINFHSQELYLINNIIHFEFHGLRIDLLDSVEAHNLTRSVIVLQLI